MKVKFLGTGTSMGVPLIGCKCEVCTSKDFRDKRLRSSILIEHRGKNILVDASSDFRLQALIYRIERVDAIFITHPHADHVFGLDDTRIFYLRQKKPMEIWGSEFTISNIKKLFFYAFEGKRDERMVKPSFNLNIIERPINLFGLKITPVKAIHGDMPVSGFRFDNFGYITDFNFIEDREIKKLKGVKTLVVGALRYTPSISHLTIDRAIEFVNRVNPEIAYFTHFSHEILHSRLEKELPENIKPAFDGLEIEVIK